MSMTTIDTALRKDISYKNPTPKDIGYIKKSEQSTIKTDYQLFVTQDVQGILKKYHPLLKSMAGRYFFNRTKDPAVEFDDLYSDNIEIALKAINYVKLEKIDENFKFGSILVDFLTGYNNSNHEKQDTQFYYLQDRYVEKESSKEQNENNSYADMWSAKPSYNKFSKSVETEFEENEAHSLAQHFYQNQTDEREKIIIDEIGRGTMIKDIAVILNAKHSANVIYWRDLLKQRFIKFMEAYGYKIEEKQAFTKKHAGCIKK
jgi:hypothetical protein